MKEYPIPQRASAEQAAKWPTDSPRLYTDEEAQEILTRAMGLHDEGMTRDSLVKMADELGISPEALERAESEWRMTSTSSLDHATFEAERAAAIRADVRDFLLGLLKIGTFFAVVALISGTAWVLMPVLFYLVGKGAELVDDLVKHSASRRGPEYDRAFARWKADRHKKLSSSDYPTLED